MKKRKKMLISRLFSFGLLVAILVFFTLGILEYFSQAYTDDCAPQNLTNASVLVPLHQLNASIARLYPQYGLYIYCQDIDCIIRVHNGSYFNQSGSVPVLFITGSADPAGRVKFLAKAAYNISRRTNTGIRLNFFVTGFNMEQSAIYGPTLREQSIYTKHSIQTILNLYSDIEPENNRPKSVVVMGNSMGGILSRSLLVPTPGVYFDPEWVRTIITLSSPQVKPVVILDSELDGFYTRVNDFWLGDSIEAKSSLDSVVIASLHGGLPDFQVRAALANIAVWKDNTPASVLFSSSYAIPTVWRSLGHVDMPWCEELVEYICLTIIDLVDANSTKQVVDSKSARQSVLETRFKYGFERVDPLSFKNNDSKVDQLSFADFFSINATRQSGSTVFSYDSIKTSRTIVLKYLTGSISLDYDSIFVYTNLRNTSSLSLTLCGSIDNNECTDFRDLGRDYGRLIPVRFYDDYLMTLNLVDFKKLVTNQNYPFLVLRIQVGNLSFVDSTPLINFDFYNKSQRFDYNYRGSSSFRINGVSRGVFRRFYLPFFTQTIQAYSYKIKTIGDQIDHPCSGLFSNRTAQQSPCVVSQFYDPTRDDNQNIYTQPLLLTKVLPKDSVAYIDVYQFDTSVNAIKIDLSVDLQAVLGQFWRFYLYSIFTYFVFIVQAYHIQVVFKRRDTVISYPQFIVVLSDLNSIASLIIHLILSLVLALVTFILQSFNSAFLRNDITEMTKNEIGFGAGIVMFMYWSSFLIVNMAFVAVLIGKFFLSFVKPTLFNCKAFKKTVLVLWIVHFALTLILLVFASALAICSIILFKIGYLIYNHVKVKAANSGNVKITKKLQSIEIELILMFVLAALNIPGLITWFGLIPVLGLVPFFLSPTSDLGLVTASLCLLLHLLDAMSLIKGRFQVYEYKFVKLVTWPLVVLVALNCMFSFFYSLLRLYRLQYFILAHLFALFFVNNLEFIVGVAMNRRTVFSSAKHRADEEEVVQTMAMEGGTEPEPSEFI